MSKLGHKQVEQMGLKWLKEQGWKIESVDKMMFQVYEAKMEDFFYKPHALVSKGNYRFWINIFDKETYVPLKRDDFGNVSMWGTGFEYYKFMGLKELERKTNIPSALLFFHEVDNEFVFRPLRELPNPTQWHKPTKAPINCLKCDKQKYLSKWLKVKPCVHYRMKFRNNKSLWNVELFVPNTAFQTTLV